MRRPAQRFDIVVVSLGGNDVGKGRQISARVACVFEVAGGCLTHERLYWDRANAMRQLGVLPAIANAATTPAVRFP